MTSRCAPQSILAARPCRADIVPNRAYLLSLVPSATVVLACHRPGSGSDVCMLRWQLRSSCRRECSIRIRNASLESQCMGSREAWCKISMVNASQKLPLCLQKLEYVNPCGAVDIHACVLCSRLGCHRDCYFLEFLWEPTKFC